MTKTYFVIIPKEKIDVFNGINNKSFDAPNIKTLVEKLEKRHFIYIPYYESYLDVPIRYCDSSLIAKVNINIKDSTDVWVVYSNRYNEDQSPEHDILGVFTTKADAMDLLFRDFLSTLKSFRATYGTQNVDCDYIGKSWKIWANDECESYEIGIEKKELCNKNIL